jgi:hypothetical protein
VWFALGDGRQLHVGVEEPFTPARKAHPAFQVKEIELLAERLAAAGRHVGWDQALPDVRRFFTEDPWGNRLELLVCLD